SRRKMNAVAPAVRIIARGHGKLVIIAPNRISDSLKEEAVVDRLSKRDHRIAHRRGIVDHPAKFLDNDLSGSPIETVLYHLAGLVEAVAEVPCLDTERHGVAGNAASPPI